MKAILLKVKNMIGYGICIFSIITGGVSTGMLFDNFGPVPFIMYILVGLLPFWLGLFMVNGMEMLPFEKGHFTVLRVYVFLSFVIPVLLGSIDYLNHEKTSTLSSITDVYLQTTSSEWMGYVVVFAGILAVFAGGRLFIVGWKATEPHVRWMFVITLLIALTFIFITRSDYQAIRTDGIVQSKLGEQEEISWNQVENVEIDGKISRDGLSQNSSFSYKWRFYFNLKDGRIIDFGPFSYHDQNLKDSLAIKAFLKEKRISWHVYNLTEKEWEYVQTDIDYEEGKPEDFYAIFQYNPDTKEYYTVPFD